MGFLKSNSEKWLLLDVMAISLFLFVIVTAGLPNKLRKTNRHQGRAEPGKKSLAAYVIGLTIFKKNLK